MDNIVTKLNFDYGPYDKGNVAYYNIIINSNIELRYTFFPEYIDKCFFLCLIDGDNINLCDYVFINSPFNIKNNIYTIDNKIVFSIQMNGIGAIDTKIELKFDLELFRDDFKKILDTIYD